MLSEKNQAAVIAVFGHPIMLDEEGQDWNALLDYVRHQAQEEAKAVSVEGWKLVPREATVDMMAAYCRQMNTGTQEVGARDEAGRYQAAAYRAMIAAAPQPPRDERPVAQCGGDAIAAMLEEDPFTIAPYRQAVDATAALTPRWMTLDRGGMIETFRAWADKQMSIHDDKTSGLAQSMRDAAFYRADALYEVASAIEEGQFDPVRPVGATASTTPDTGAEKVAAQVDQPIREALNPLPNQHTRDRIAELEAILRPVANLYGTKPPYVVIGRTVREAHFALQAKGAE